jgi:hypothetical protein
MTTSYAGLALFRIELLAIASFSSLRISKKRLLEFRCFILNKQLSFKLITYLLSSFLRKHRKFSNLKENRSGCALFMHPVSAVP